MQPLFRDSLHVSRCNRQVFFFFRLHSNSETPPNAKHLRYFERFKVRYTPAVKLKTTQDQYDMPTWQFSSLFKFDFCSEVVFR